MVPPVTTPVDAARELDLRRVPPRVEPVVAPGVCGLAVGCSTGEGRVLDGEEPVRRVAAD